MARPVQNYSEEMRQRAVRMVFEVQDDYETQFPAIEAVAQKLGIGTADALRRWVRKAEIDPGERAGSPARNTPTCGQSRWH